MVGGGGWGGIMTLGQKKKKKKASLHAQGACDEISYLSHDSLYWTGLLCGSKIIPRP